MRLDDRFAEHPQIAGLNSKAFRLYVESLCWLSDTRQPMPYLAPTILRRVLGVGRHPRKYVDQLVDAGLWLPDLRGGYTVNVVYARLNKPRRTDWNYRARAAE